MSDMVPSDIEWAVVARTSGMTEAHILVESLRAAGIPAWIDHESAGAAIGLSVGLIGRIEVVVPVEQYDQALELLEGDSDETYPELDEPEDEDE